MLLTLRCQLGLAFCTLLVRAWAAILRCHVDCRVRSATALNKHMNGKNRYFEYFKNCEYFCYYVRGWFSYYCGCDEYQRLYYSYGYVCPDHLLFIYLYGVHCTSVAVPLELAHYAGGWSLGRRLLLQWSHQNGASEGSPLSVPNSQIAVALWWPPSWLL